MYLRGFNNQTARMKLRNSKSSGRSGNGRHEGTQCLSLKKRVSQLKAVWSIWKETLFECIIKDTRQPLMTGSNKIHRDWSKSCSSILIWLNTMWYLLQVEGGHEAGHRSGHEVMHVYIHYPRYRVRLASRARIITSQIQSNYSTVPS